ncbi:Transposon Tf2-6 polyprotein [Labeo rohita]|uniref:Gypsy retrotransposon integrase-like protein 1 n=1 Tax=Labeo rohita TaxID=84645 RepID=A0ABQ8LIM4_LABRO|nr:Transposon Tf2-6 polyprotein [Labeo rohita]
MAHLPTAKLGVVEQRWVAQLASYDFVVKYRAGRENGNADSLSRLPVCPTEPKPSGEVQHTDASGDVTLPGALGTDEWREAQQEDEDLQLVMQYVSSASVPSGPERRTLPVMVQQLLRHVSRLTVIDGVLYKRMTDPNTHECQFQIVCSAAKQEEIWQQYHEALAHAGIERTLTRVRYHFFWPKMEEVVRGFHSGCIACSLQKEKNSCKALNLNPISVSCPLEIIALEFLSLGRPNDIYQNILVMINMFTRYAWAVPTKDQTAQTTVRALWTNVVQTFGCPLRFHSDRGPNFESESVQEFCQLYGTTKSRTTPYHPAGIGRVVGVNQTLLNMLRTLEKEKQDRWPDFLSELMQAYNNTVHSATGFAPSYLMFGRTVRIPVDLELGVLVDQQKRGLRGWVQDHYKKIKWVYAVAKSKMDQSAETMKQTYDHGAKDVPLLIGQRVWVRDRNRQGRGKLCRFWDPLPHVIVGTLGEMGLVYRVKPEKGGKEKVLHRNALKWCTAPEAEVILIPLVLHLQLQPEILYLIASGLPRLLNLLMWGMTLLDESWMVD